MGRKWIASRSAVNWCIWCWVFGARYFFFLSYFDFLFLLSVFICVNPWFHSYARAGIAAAGLYGHAAAAAKRTFGSVVTLDFEVHEGFGANGQLDFSAAAIDQRARGNHARARFFQHANRFARRAARGPHIFHDQHVFVRLDSKSPAQRQRSQGVPFDENRANGFAVRDAAESLAPLRGR